MTDFTPGDSSITYEYSIDNGSSWQVVLPDCDVLFDQPAMALLVRAVYMGEEAELYRMELQGILELNPATFTVDLEGEAKTLSVSVPEAIRKAKTPMQAFPQNVQAVWYLNQKKAPFEGDVFDALICAESSNHTTFD